MSKIKDNPALIAEAHKKIADLQSIIENMDEKRGTIFIDWLGISNNYLMWEKSFDPKRIRAFRRSEIVLAHFGFNVGSEFGGTHYAVVVSDSSKSNPLVNVIPLSSLKVEETEEDEEIEKTIHRDCVYLGAICGLNDKSAVGVVNQLRPISKLRIINPKKQYQNVFKLDNDQMDKLDDKVRRMYTRLR